MSSEREQALKRAKARARALTLASRASGTADPLAGSVFGIPVKAILVVGVGLIGVALWRRYHQ